MTKIRRGEIWLTRLDPTVGSEINKTRPAVVISRTDYNLLADTVTIIPISTKRFIPSFHVSLRGLKDESHAVIPQVRVAGQPRFIKKIGKITEDETKEIEMKLKFYLDFR